MDINAISDNTRYISEWLATAKSLYFFLPDGPYGRPFDNSYTYEGIVSDAPEDVKFMLSESICLHFVGKVAIQEEPTKLFLSGFQKFEFIESGRVRSVYSDGSVCLVKFE